MIRMVRLNSSSQKDTQKHWPRPTRTSMQSCSTRYLVCLLLATLWTSSVCGGLSSFANNHTSGQQVSTTSPPTNTKTSDSKSSQASSTGTKTTQSATEQQQPQSSDLASMYVQIPIAEPAENGGSELSQQSISDTEGSDQQKATSWKGPWPKKFQIGYIKQSDLHQVLIESLKNEPFVSLAGESGATGSSAAPSQSSSTKTAQTQSSAASKSPAKSPPSDTSSLMTPNKQPPPQWQNQDSGLAYSVSPAGSRIPVVMGKPATGYNNHNQQKMVQPQYHENSRGQLRLQRFHPMSGYNANGAHLSTPVLQHHLAQPNPGIYGYGRGNTVEQPNGQYHFAGFPSNLFKNQPIYTTINGNNNGNTYQSHHTQFDNIHHIGMPQAQIHSRPQKSADYYTNWRPVTSDKDEASATKSQNLQPVFQQDYPGISDGFDDGFMTPAGGKDSTTMNRHPVLNNYMSPEQQMQPQQPASKLSPSMVVNKTKQPQFETKGSTKSSSAATKTGTKSTEGTQVGGTKSNDSGMNLSGARKRTQNRTTSSTSTQSSSTTMDSSTTTLPFDSAIDQSTTDQASGNTTTTTINTVSSTSAPGSSTQSTTNADANGEPATQEPDSEVIETTDTETTTSASSTVASRASGSAGDESTTTTTSTLSSAGQEGVSSTATSSPSSTFADNETTTASSSEDASTSGAASSSSTQRSSSREETTPSGGSQSTESAPSETKGGEVEGTSASSGTSEFPATSSTMAALTDEALQAAAVRTGSEIGKTNSDIQRGQQRSQVASSASKKVRSSERLVANSNRKSANNNLQAGKRPQQASRTAKQVNGNEQQAVKGRTNKSRSKQSLVAQTNKQLKTGGTGKAFGKQASAKSTRMVPGGQQSERLQQAPQIVSMTAAQAQSTAQTLASLLLSRCLSSANCVHLLDICSTKQAMVPLFGSELNADSALLAASAANQTNGIAAAWSVPVGLVSSSIMNLVQTLQADRALSLFPAWKDAIENVVDHDTSGGYTLILPSNEAIDRLPAATQNAWLAEPELMNQIIDNHIIDSSSEVIDFAASSPNSIMRQPGRSKIIKGKGLQVNQHREKMVTINGKRLVYANQPAPAGGRIHVIDGVLDWTPAQTGAGQQAKLLDIMDTLKQCDKFDGFVTLAEGTGLTQILKQDGPMTVFVPSNEALRKIPDEELEVIKNNSTALKEFLMYHVVNGSYFSQDLRDGQQLSSILDMKPIQVGVRVDGCSRRLVEANTSPMRRADIVARNGVIHILDWYLTVRDNVWCDPIGVPTSTTNQLSSVPPPTPSSSPASERLQQLASDSAATVYATRVALPANHKLSPTQLHDGQVSTLSLISSN